MGRATCSDDIVACIADPFGAPGAPCDAVAYEDRLAAYCVADATTFDSNCMDGTHGVAEAVNTARKTLVTNCLSDGSAFDTAVCNQFIQGESGTTVAACILNPFLTTNGCNVNDAFFDVQAARNRTCTSPDSSFHTDCDIVSAENTDTVVAGNIRAARGRACVGLSTDERVANNCGNEAGVGGTYIQAYCVAGGAAASNHRDCPNTYETAQGSDAATVEKLTSGGVDRALNSTGTGLLGAFAGQGTPRKTHAEANFIISGPAVLALHDGTGAVIADTTTLTLGALADTPAPTFDGFAVGSATFTDTPDGGGAAVVNKHLYVGILSRTNLGSPVSSTARGTWTGRLRLLTATGADDFDIALDVNVTGQTITQTGTLPNITAINSNFGTINIDGKFTANGVIYGTVDFGEDNGNNTVATLTGLIGTDGAVGIFRSNTDATTAYVGGFVAEKSAIPAGCLANAMPFDTACVDNSVRLRLCSGSIADLTGAGGNPTVADCNTPELSGAICGTGVAENSIPGENPFAPICFDGRAYPAEFGVDLARKLFATKCFNGTQTTNCDQSANGILGGVSIIDCANNPYDTTNDPHSCSTNPAFEDLLSARRIFCRDTDPFNAKCNDNPIKTADQQNYCAITGNTWKVNCNEHKNFAAVKTTRDKSCTDHGAVDAGTGNDCDTRANVRAICDPNPYAQTDVSRMNLCTGTNAGGVNYSVARTNCETASTTFANDYCTAHDTSNSDVDTARDTYCETLASGNDPLCNSRVAEICTAGPSSTSPFATLCGTEVTDAQRAVCLATGTSSLPNQTCSTIVSGICDSRPFEMGTTSNMLLCNDQRFVTARQMQCSDGMQTTPALCNTPEIESVVCAASGDNANPFATFCGDEVGTSTSGTIVAVQQNFCGSTPRTASDAHSVSECDGLLDTLCIDTGNNGANSVTTAGAASYNCLLDTTTNVAAARVSFCETPDKTYTTGCTTDIGAVLAVRKTLAEDCVTAGAGGTGCSQEVATGLTVATCSANPYLTACEVSGVIEAFNTVRFARNNLCTSAMTSFNPLCDIESVTGTDATFVSNTRIARGEACANDAIDTTSETCGDEGTQNSYLAAYCGSDNSGVATNVRDCPAGYARLNATAVANVSVAAFDASGENQPLNADGSAELDVLPQDGVNQTNPLTNYIVGTADGLNLGFNQSEGSVPNTISLFNIGGLKLSDLDSVDAPAGDTDGVSFATFANSDSTDTTGGSDGTDYNDPRYYAGLWNGTDLGAPLNSTEQSATWKGKIALVISGLLYSTVGFDLVVEFGGTDGNTLIAEDITLTANDNFTINGKFTSAGVIYGTTTFGPVGFESTGSLTGLIGVRGAVGAFVSTSETANDYDEYAGGFVAAPSDEGLVVVVNCSADGTPFNLTDCPDAGDVRLAACGGTIDALNAVSGGNLEACNTAELSGAICASSGASANPFAPICSEPMATAHNTEFDQVTVQVAFCNTNSDNSECELPAWKLHARNTDDTGRLDVLVADGVNQTNPLTNYIVGTADGLNLGFNQSNVPNTISLFNIGGLKLSDLDSVDAPAGDTDGVSFATFANSDSTDTTGGSDGTVYNAPRYYAGLWNGTDLGAPLNSTEQSATWKGKIALVTSGLLYSTVGFDLVVKFGGTDGNTLIAEDITLTADDNFTINGKFTSAGVIYGTTSFESFGSESTGSLTGLIGVRGAVGAFVSTSETANDYDEFAGGFVAAPSDEGLVVVVNCSADGTPFNLTDCPDAGDVRLAACGGTIDALNAVDGGSLEACNTAELSGAICASTGASANPFAPICSEPMATAHNTEFDQVTVQVAFCNTNSDNSECELPAWKLHARNTDDTGRLDVLVADGVNQTNPLTNYIVGTADGLNLGFNQSNVPNTISLFNIGGLKLSDLDSVDAPAGDTDGVSFATFVNSDSTDTTGGSDGTVYNAPRYYAGLWNGTDLGAPLNSTEQSATWKGKIALVTSGLLYSTVGFDLVVEFGGTDGNTLIAENIPLTADDKFTINGKFTSAGVIYGTTTFEAFGSESTGSLTGLIGVRGAVGAFVSTSETANDYDEYAGGFVAAPSDEEPVVVVNCTTDGEAPDPFNAACTSSTNYALQAQLCRDNDATPVANFNTNCVMNSEVTNRVCATRGTYANPFNDVCANQNDVKLQVCRGALSDLTAVGGSLESCNNAQLSGAICASMGANANPFSPICYEPEATAYNPNFDRLAVVNGYCLDTTSNSGANPFNPGCSGALYDVARGAACVAGFVNSDCGAEGTAGTYINAFCGSEAGKTASTGCPVRFAFIEDIKFCMDGMQASDSRCMNSDVAAITGPCLLDPFEKVCSPYATEYMTERDARLATCRGNAKFRGDTLCNKTRPTICAIDATPFASVCGAKTGKWLNQQHTIIAGCLTGDAEDRELYCNIPVFRNTVQACLDNPFLTCSTDLESVWVSRQATIVDNCAGNDQHADCSLRVTGRATVGACILDPFSPLCSAAAFTNQRNAVCDVAETSFNAHCLASDAIAGTRDGRPKDIAAERARRALVANCSDANDGNNTGCDTAVVADGATLAQCIANPFLADCSADVIYRALSAPNSTDAIAKRDALLAKCAPDAMPTDADCTTPIAGGQTIANCIANPFDANCSVTDMTSDAFAAFGAYRAPVCTTAATSFTDGCDEVTYAGTDTARAELALSCAVDSNGTGCGAGTIMVSASLTVNACNTNPFAEGCESPAFINARLESCKGASPHADCSVADGQGYTNYVAGSETSLEGIYVEDNDETTQNETYVYVEDDPLTTSIDESVAYVKQANGVDYVVAMETVEECMIVGFRQDSRVCNDVQRPVADNPSTPIDESRVRMVNRSDTAVDESRIRITQDDPNTYLDETRALVDNSVQASGLTLADAGADGDATAGFVLAYFATGRDTTTGVAGTDRYYAGLLSGTNAGTVGGVLTADDFPIPETGNDVKGEWTAKLAIINNGRAVETADFKLDVNFTASTIGAAGTRPVTTVTNGVPTQMIDPVTNELEVDDDGNPVLRVPTTMTTVNEPTDFVTIAGGQFVIDGKFTAQGVIYGTTRLGDGNINGESSRGTLTGLIGTQGAVGAFVSSGEGALINTYGEFAGGFVATAPAPADGAGYTAFKTHYSAQTGSRQLFAEIASDARTGRGFLQGTRTGLVENNIRFDTDTSQQAVLYDASHFNSIAVRLNEETTGDDGFAVLVGATNGARFAVGLLSGTDLGAPLPTEAAATVEWTGSLHYANTTTEGLTKSADTLTLLVDVNEGTLRTKTRVEVSVGANLGTIRTIAIDGRFGERLDNDGNPLPGHLPVSILGGTVSLYDNDGSGEGIKGSDSPLIGLIGTEGVLGVFTTSSLVGGFQASGVLPTGMKPVDPTGPTGPTDVVEVTGTTAYQAWAASLGDDLRASNYATPAGASADFIRLDASNNIVAPNFTDVNSGSESAPLYLKDSTTSGVVYGQAFDANNNVQLYAGLLPTTDLGAPLTDGTKDGTWTGTLAGYNLATGSAISDTTFNMTVAFGAGTKAGTIKSLNQTFQENFIGGLGGTLYFDGEFDANGVMSGTTTGAGAANGTFNGLIGVNGAVGAFKGINGTGTQGYVGGFQVSPSD